MSTLYLDLLRSNLTGMLLQDPAIEAPFDEDRRRNGRDWPAHAETMIGAIRLEHLQRCIENVLVHEIPGDLAECGVWRGGAAILMRAVLVANQVTDRTVWVCDTFTGMPESPHPADAGYRWPDTLAVSLAQVQANFARYGFANGGVRYLPGLFADTLPGPIRQLAVLRLDGDLYMSTMDCLVALYDTVSEGGYIIVDDYGAVAACRQAVEEFRARLNITDQIHVIDWTGIFWRKGGDGGS